jgi:putative glutamine amidotransferase
MTPLVAVTTTTVVLETSRHRQPEISMYAAYASILERLGLTSVLVTPVHTKGSLRRLARLCCGMVLTGGEDIDPACYGAEPIPELEPVNKARDVAELQMVELALEEEIPILGICRGCQLLNVSFGGTLYQDLDRERPGALRHSQREPWGMRSHRAEVEPDSLLGRMLDMPVLEINSFHHQAIRDVGDGLRVVARADDGLVEAVEAVDHRWVLGVQWHPERHEATAPAQDPDRRLIRAFAEAVRERS